MTGDELRNLYADGRPKHGYAVDGRPVKTEPRGVWLISRIPLRWTRPAMRQGGQDLPPER